MPLSYRFPCYHANFFLFFLFPGKFISYMAGRISFAIALVSKLIWLVDRASLLYARDSRHPFISIYRMHFNFFLQFVYDSFPNLVTISLQSHLRSITAQFLFWIQIYLFHVLFVFQFVDIECSVLPIAIEENASTSAECKQYLPSASIFLKLNVGGTPHLLVVLQGAEEISDSLGGYVVTSGMGAKGWRVVFKKNRARNRKINMILLKFLCSRPPENRDPESA